MRVRGGVVRWLGAIALLVSLIAVMPSAPVGAATTRHVTNCDPEGSGSLSDTVENVAGDGDTVVFDLDCPATSPILPLEPIFVDRDMTIDATGHTIVVDGSNVGDTIFFVGSEVPITVEITGLTIQNGSSETGGAIDNEGAALTVRNTAFTNNFAFSGAAIYSVTCDCSSNGSLSVIGSTFTNNTALFGGAIGAGNPTSSVTGSVFRNNIAVFGGAIVSEGSTVTVTGSTFDSNQARISVLGDPRKPAGITVQASTPTFGGAILALAGTLNVTNSTFGGNQADTGGALYVASPESAETQAARTLIASAQTALSPHRVSVPQVTPQQTSAAILTNVTINGNQASVKGGGIVNGGGTVQVSNTIVANNIAPSGTENCADDSLIIPTGVTTSAATITDGGHNLEFNPSTTCGFTLAAQTGDPKLAPLADNGGPTPTMALGLGSAALDTGDAGICAITTGAAPVGGVDQRGLPRPATACSIGAFEPQPATLAPSGTPQSATIGAPFATALNVVAHDSVGNPLGGYPITFTAPASGASGTFAGGSATATATTAIGASGASAPVFTANNAAGTYTVTAILASPALSAPFALTNLPIAATSEYRVPSGGTLAPAAPGVLTGTQGGSGPTAAIATPPTHAASFTLNPDGSFSYTSIADFVGTDTFTYTATIGGAVSAPATVTITVYPPTLSGVSPHPAPAGRSAGAATGGLPPPPAPAPRTGNGTGTSSGAGAPPPAPTGR